MFIEYRQARFFKKIQVELLLQKYDNVRPGLYHSDYSPNNNFGAVQLSSTNCPYHRSPIDKDKFAESASKMLTKAFVFVDTEETQAEYESLQLGDVIVDDDISKTYEIPQITSNESMPKLFSKEDVRMMCRSGKFTKDQSYMLITLLKSRGMVEKGVNSTEMLHRNKKYKKFFACEKVEVYANEKRVKVDMKTNKSGKQIRKLVNYNMKCRSIKYFYYCIDIKGLFQAMNCSFSPEASVLYIDSARKNLKCMLMDPHGIDDAIPIGYGVGIPETYLSLAQILHIILQFQIYK